MQIVHIRERKNTSSKGIYVNNILNCHLFGIFLGKIKKQETELIPNY